MTDDIVMATGGLPEEVCLPDAPRPETLAMRRSRWRDGLRYGLGLDKAIAFSVLSRVCSALGSVGTVLFIMRFLTPTEQGYYYALWSLVALQSVFELGFSFVILQIAAHETPFLKFHADGSVTGSERAHGRLASILQHAVRWYAVAAVVMGLLLLAGGTYFFASHQGSATTNWVWPLRLTVFACALTFSLGPVLSFLEGCGQVTAVARMRLLQAIVSTTCAWAAMLTHHGLFAPAIVLLGQGVVASAMLYSRRRLLVPLLRLTTSENRVSWRGEVWPFQWKIAVSWIADYFIFQLFTPVLFVFRGPVEAGRMGVSMSIVMQLSGMMLVWMSTKAAPFGGMIASRSRTSLDSLFFVTLKQSLGIFAACSVVILVGVAIVERFLPAIGQRLVSWPVFLLLLLTALSSHVVQSEALYLRAHKCEPFLVQSMVIAALTAAGVLSVARAFGALGVSLAYFLVLGVAGLVSATVIFRARRRRWSAEIAEAH